tara:strand:+ start:76 stop:303 length:228 start_codon:yes stop_codon:yes gene_type:complete
MTHTHKLIDGVRVDLTAEEITELNAKDEIENKRIAELATAEEEERTARENLKASAKAKLIAGEPLTEEEANTIVL